MIILNLLKSKHPEIKICNRILLRKYIESNQMTTEIILEYGSILSPIILCKRQFWLLMISVSSNYHMTLIHAGHKNIFKT